MNSSFPEVRLSCEQCQRRKTKCDKQSPCSACKTARIKCNVVQRARRPRGKSAKNKRQEIDIRIARLEDLVKDLKAGVQSGKHHDEDETRVETESPVVDNNNGIEYVASDFWEALSSEVTGIRDILQEPQSQETTPQEYDGESPSSAGILLFNSSMSNGRLYGQPPLTEQAKTTLFGIYQTRVDTIFKVLHWPSAIIAMSKKDPDAQTTARVEALEYAICFTALCTLRDDECERELLCGKAPLLQQLKISAESSLSKAQLLDVPDVTVLQAFVVYLVGLRCSTNSASSWTLLSIAVRLGQSLGLGSDDTTKRTLYELEIRRRLWFSIGVLDSQSALDRGSLPLLYNKDFETPPANINDSDLNPTMTSIPSRECFTDMTFSFRTYEAMIAQKKLYISINSDDPWTGWNEKAKAVTEYEDYVKQHLSNVDTSKPIQRFAKSVAYGALSNIKLMLRRPPWRVKNHAIPPWDDFNIMETTTQTLEGALIKRATMDFDDWTWYSWVKWYALAVLLAELCGRSTGSDVEHSYGVAQKSFLYYSTYVADSKNGMLWSPIVKLMRRVQQLRGITVQDMPNLLQSSTQSTPNLSSVPEVSFPHNQELQELSIGAKDKTGYANAYPNDLRPDSLISLDLTDGNLSEEYNPELAINSIDTGMPWINWDTFLEDMNSNSMEWTNV